MMSHPIVSTERLQDVFTALQKVDDTTILGISKAFEYPDATSAAIVKAFRALVADVPSLSCASHIPLERIGIVGASTVPTALWPYLIIAYAIDVSVRVKVRPDDVRSLETLAAIIRHAFGTRTQPQFIAGDMPWDVTVEAGDVLLNAGYWDDCDRLLVFGSDATLDIYRQRFSNQGRVIGFGHVESLLAVDIANVCTDARWMTDLLTFGHIGCLAPRLVVPTDNCTLGDLADVMIRHLNGSVIPDIERAIALRQEFQARTVHGQPVWLSKDGMWLISSDDSVATTHIAGHLQLVQPSVVSASKCRVAAFSAPTRRVFESTDVLQLQTRATWNCEWGMAQFPSITWCNSGISTIDVLCSLAMIKDPVYP